ncbi:NUDIX domain-containing protein [Kordia sp. YSTF-M3]|uniref:NUDIX domain-containing protein n=1 Tax=Kordia aestuariivivens TaxID=2759037 RepID=A0ABR7QCW9_9FLAO|nr:NUDIX domain-containing protein [Kordia aestuariivivens]MBC8756422.1 NUDIX domain-containing protein [Kordia aestuariivivens]
MELLDILDNNGKPTGEYLPKDEVHRNGYFHGTVHVWLYTKRGEVVLQLRAADKQNFPNRWDVSVAGHISHGETALQAAQRELEEELGIQAQPAQFQKIANFQIDYKHAADYWDREFSTIYACEIAATTEFTLQTAEVAAVTTIPLAQVQKELATIELAQKYVPFNEAYAKEVFAKLKRFF